MQTVLYILARTAQLFFGMAELAMFLRAILSWFVADEENRFMLFLVAVTEPIILPIRFICSRFSALDDAPLDIPFFIAFLLLSVLNGLLPQLAL